MPTSRLRVLGWRLCMVLVATAALLSAVGSARGSDGYEPTKESLDQHPLPRWWDEAKFGIFIHWGVYSVPGFGAPWPDESAVLGPLTGIDYIPAEWYWYAQQVSGSKQWAHHLQTFGPDLVYDDFIPSFTADNFDPNAWIELFEDAGAKYFVLTSKHHDGFALYPSDTTQRDSMDLGPHRDLVGELFDAAHRAGDRVKPGLYYSIPEWFNPAPRPVDWEDDDLSGAVLNGVVLFRQGTARNAYTQTPALYTGYMPIEHYAAGQVRPQLRELIDRYHPYELWCDIGGREGYFRSNESIAYYYNQSSATNPEGVVVNDRCGDADTHSDYDTWEATNAYGSGPPFGSARSETVRTMGNSWGYDTGDADSTMLPVNELVDLLVTVVSNNSNLLLNIGPRSDGTIPDAMQQRLRSIGEWLQINGEAIYGTHPWTQGEPAGDVRFTVGVDGAFYITALNWPGRELTVDAPVPLPLEEDSQIVLLGSDGTPLSYRTEGTKLIVTMPAGGDQALATISQHAFVLRVAPSSA